MIRMPHHTSYNLIPFGIRGVSSKPKRGIKLDWQDRLPEWKKYQTQWYSGVITKQDNLLMMTGNLPDNSKQIVVVDVDGRFNLRQCKEICGSIKGLFAGLAIAQVNLSGSGGLHFFFHCDTEVQINNTQKSVVREGLFPSYIKGVDIRANGGLLFYPPTKFVDSGEYRVLWMNSRDTINCSTTVKLIIEEMYVNTQPDREIIEPFDLTKISQNIDYVEEISPMREPLRDLLCDGAQDIEQLSMITGVDEFLYWKALFLEVKARDVPLAIAFDLLARNQPYFDLNTTLDQLQYLGNTPFSNAKLSELFPHYDIEPKIRNRAEIINEEQ